MTGGNRTSNSMIMFESQREKHSMEELLRKVEEMSDEDIQKEFNLMPHQVMDVKDVLRRAKL